MKYTIGIIDNRGNEHYYDIDAPDRMQAVMGVFIAHADAAAITIQAAGRPGLPGWRVLLAMLRGWLAGDFVSVSDPDDPRPGRQWLAERIRGRWPGTSLLLTWFGLVPGTPPDLSR